MSTRAEQITSEVKRLVLTCRKLEADLAQSVPKKVMDEAVAKMQQKIDILNAELSHTKSDLESANLINERLESLGKQLATQRDQISTQNEVINSISAKLGCMIPSEIYEQANLKIHELEQQVQTKNNEYETLQANVTGLEQKISGMVPRDEFVVLQTALANSVPKEKYDEDIRRIHEETVSKDKYDQVESRLTVLETQLANSMPKSEFEELSQSITALTKSASFGNDGEAPEQVAYEQKTIGELESAPTPPTVAVN